MEFFQELLFSVVLSFLVSFILAKLLSMASGYDAERIAVLTSKTVVREQEDGNESAVWDFESEKRVRFVEEAVKVNESEGKIEGREFDNEQVCREVEVVGLGEDDMEGSVFSENEERESVGGGQVTENVVDESFGMEGFRGIEIESENLVGESPASVAKSEEVGVLEDGSNMGELKNNGVDDDDDEEEEEKGFFDDWEGIERTELEKHFGAAVVFVESKNNADCISILDNDVKMQLCGLHKVAIEGPCCEPQPMALKVSARAKWNAWKRLANMSPEVAMEQYITLLSRSIPGWMGDDTSEVRTNEACVEERNVIGFEGPNFINRDKQ